MMLEKIKKSLSKNLDQFKNMSPDEIFNDRKNKFLKIGRSKGFITNLDELSSLKKSDNKVYSLFKSKNLIIISSIVLVLIISLFLFL